MPSPASTVPSAASLALVDLPDEVSVEKKHSSQSPAQHCVQLLLSARRRSADDSRRAGSGPNLSSHSMERAWSGRQHV